jgi:hypothetical protein
LLDFWPGDPMETSPRSTPCSLYLPPDAAPGPLGLGQRAFHGENLKKWMVYNGKTPWKFEWFGGSPISGNHHINHIKSMGHDRDI